jgi:hypothetical protein
MAKVVPLNRLLKVLFYFLLAMACFVLGVEVSDRILARPDASLMLRWFAVVLGTVSIVPWMLTVLWSVGAGDEYVRRIALVGTAVAFAGDLLLHVAFNLLQDAKIIGWDTHLQPVAAAMVLWVLGICLTSLYYRYRP